MIDSCLRLHGQLCPPEMLGFHTTLEGFFRKNFHEEIQRLAMDWPSGDGFISTRAHHDLDVSPHYQMHAEQRSIDYGLPESSPLQRVPPPLDLRRTVSTAPSLVSPPKDNGQSLADGLLPPKQTPLQRGLAHLARHGVNGVASSPRDTVGSDFEGGSPHDSLTNGSGGPVANLSGAASYTTSTIGSIGSLKGRFSRLGSLNFGRRDG